MTEGYLTDKECEQCGKYTLNNFIEPRFGYVTCQECKTVPPMERNRYDSTRND